MNDEDYIQGMHQAQCAIEVALNDLVDKRICTNEQIIDALLWWSEQVNQAYPPEGSPTVFAGVEGTLQ
jgi:hypothetical protein